MKTPTLRSIALTLLVTITIGSYVNRRAAAAASPANAVVAGEFIVDPPTLINLGFEWFMQGDDNRNASVDVSYRKQGSGEWKQGLPLHLAFLRSGQPHAKIARINTAAALFARGPY